MARFDLTDFEWSVIQPLLRTKVRGVPRVDDRRVLNGIFWGSVANVGTGRERLRKQEFQAAIWKRLVTKMV